MHFDPQRPYNRLPDLPPNGPIETVPVLKAINRASRSLAELKGRTHTIPNPTILLNTIGLQEAKLSSEIENIFTTNDELYSGLSLEANGGLAPHAKEVLHYREALWHGVESFKKRPVFSTNLAIEIVNTIKEHNAGIRKLPGTKIKNPATGEIVYTPPEGEDLIREKLAKLDRFCGRQNKNRQTIRSMTFRAPSSLPSLPRGEG
jgi:Fic family protein